ncbi:hypothetical protein LNQ03_12690 [Klebsiella pneumoniae subsp. pneumoniae]|nr:hypothetical protein [Klebsiella pneumoniae subsp. pneumoniae]
MRFVLLTSGANVADYASASADAQQSEMLKGLKVALSKAEGEKCPRCWHYTTDIGKVAGTRGNLRTLCEQRRR